MDNLFLEPTKNSPMVCFDARGILIMKGRCYPENVYPMFYLIFEFAQKLVTKKVDIEIDLEYYNTATVKMLLSLFYQLEKREDILEVDVNWYYDIDDMDSRDTALVLAEKLQKVTFNVIETEAA